MSFFLSSSVPPINMIIILSSIFYQKDSKSRYIYIYSNLYIIKIIIKIIESITILISLTLSTFFSEYTILYINCFFCDLFPSNSFLVGFLLNGYFIFFKEIHSLFLLLIPRRSKKHIILV